jgi:hypothetical protein
MVVQATRYGTANSRRSVAFAPMLHKPARRGLCHPVRRGDEPRFRLGEDVKAGQIAGYIHDPLVPWRAPDEIRFEEKE